MLVYWRVGRNFQFQLCRSMACHLPHNWWYRNWRYTMLCNLWLCFHQKTRFWSQSGANSFVEVLLALGRVVGALLVFASWYHKPRYEGVWRKMNWIWMMSEASFFLWLVFSVFIEDAHPLYCFLFAPFVSFFFFCVMFFQVKLDDLSTLSKKLTAGPGRFTNEDHWSVINWKLTRSQPY